MRSTQDLSFRGRGSIGPGYRNASDWKTTAKVKDMAEFLETGGDDFGEPDR